jgi:hypothetical protein
LFAAYIVLFLTALQTFQFYLIHVNYFCRQENGMFTPCEIALAEFSFLEGNKRVYHTLINPGEYTVTFVQFVGL